MVVCIPQGTERQCEYTDLGDCLRDNSAACWGGSGGGAALDEATTAGHTEDEDGGGNYGWKRGGEEGAVAFRRYWITYRSDWYPEDIRLRISEDEIMFLTDIDAVSFHGFRSILQHEVRYPLAEAVNSV